MSHRQDLKIDIANMIGGGQGPIFESQAKTED